MNTTSMWSLLYIDKNEFEHKVNMTYMYIAVYNKIMMQRKLILYGKRKYKTNYHVNIVEAG